MPIFPTERAGAEVVECACVIELPELKVHPTSNPCFPCLRALNYSDVYVIIEAIYLYFSSINHEVLDLDAMRRAYRCAHACICYNLDQMTQLTSSLSLSSFACAL